MTTPFELALDLRRDAALLTGHVDLELVFGWGVVAAIAGIGDAAIEDVADERLHLRNDRAECVPVIGVAGQCCGVGDELRRHLTSKLGKRRLTNFNISYPTTFW